MIDYCCLTSHDQYLKKTHDENKFDFQTINYVGKNVANGSLSD
jgi:hypothetical protein